MINETKIIDVLNESFQKEVDKHEEHKSRVLKAIQWWNEKSVPSVLEGFVNCRIWVNDVECLCTLIDLRGTPYYNVNFEVRPLSSSNDAGSGAGAPHRVSF